MKTNSIHLMIQANRLDILESLLLNVTHEMNNALNVIQLETEPLKMNMLQNKIDKIVEATKLLQIYINKPMTTDSLFNLNDCIKDCLQLCGAIIRNQIKIDCHLSPKIGKIKGNKMQLKQVIMNLILNAFISMEVKDQLNIVTEQQENMSALLLTYTRKNSRLITNEFSDLSHIVIQNIIELHHGVIHVHSDSKYNFTSVKIPLYDSRLGI